MTQVPAPEPRLETIKLVLDASPALSIEKRVFVDEPITNTGAVPLLAVGLMENCPNGVELPIPTKPADVNVVEAITEVEEANRPDERKSGEEVAAVVVPNLVMKENKPFEVR